MSDVHWTDQALRDGARLHALVLDENVRQLGKWGVQCGTPFEWLAYLHEESGELAKAICEWYYRGGKARIVRHEAIQLATLALKVAEMIERYPEPGADDE